MVTQARKLVAVRIPRDLDREFEIAVARVRTTKTAVLLAAIKRFVKSHRLEEER